MNKYREKTSQLILKLYFAITKAYIHPLYHSTVTKAYIHPLYHSPVNKDFTSTFCIIV